MIDWIDANELSRRAGVSTETIQRNYRTGKIKAVRIERRGHRRYLFHPEHALAEIQRSHSDELREHREIEASVWAQTKLRFMGRYRGLKVYPVA